MQKKPVIIFGVLLLLAANVYAGRYAACPNKGGAAAARTTMADRGEDDYDVKHLRFNLRVSDTSTYLRGDVTTMAQVTATVMTFYTFELDTSLTIDSAKINGVNRAVITTGSVRKVYLPVALTQTNYFTAQIFYHGLPPSGSGFFNGITHSVSGGGTHMVFTLSDPWVAKNWWPAKQSATDKIDSVDMIVTVPKGVVDGSNGVLLGIDSVSEPGAWTYHWQTHYMIDYYLISMSVARYGIYRSYWHFTGSTDSVLIQNFFLDTLSFNPTQKIKFDSIGYMIDYFSTLYGRYPFWREKYGVCFTTLPGGMEHQTMTTIGVTNTYIIAHELGHQWWGDNVTYKNWGDVWLSEGFATFTEQLYLNKFWSATEARTHRQTYLNKVFTQPCGMVYVTDTTTSDSLFDATNVYAKGQGVVTMLRYAAPSDSAFFQVLKTYQSVYGLKNAGTAEFKQIAESVYGYSLDTFFKQWIYGRGFPQYRISWNQVGSKIFLQLVQSASCPSYTQHFSTPLQLQLHGATADTVIKVYNNADTQLYVLNWSPTMTNVILNPDAVTICKQLGTTVHDATLHASALPMPDIKVLPNPSKNNWHIAQLPEATRLTLCDMSGKLLWQGQAGKSGATIPGETLPAGDYMLKLSGSAISESIQLVHW